MGPFSAAMLVNAGFSILGGIGDVSAAKHQRRMEELSNNYNAALQKNQVVGEYNSLFEKQKQQLGTQKAALANMGVDKAGSLYNESLRSHEKNFLKSTQDMKKDLENISFNQSMANTQASIDYHARKSQAINKAVSGVMSAGSNWASKKGYMDWLYQDKWTMPKVGGK